MEVTPLLTEEIHARRGRRRRAVDSAILADAVATQDTVTQLVSAVRRVAREVSGAAQRVAAVCTGHDYSKPGKPKIDRDDPQAKDALVSALVNDANALVGAFKGAELDEGAASALALLALVAGQDAEPAEGSDGRDGRWRIARKVAEDRVVSAVDPDARHTRKSPDDLLRAARRDWAATGLRKDYMAWRPNVERAIAQVATFRGRRLKLRYRGVTKNHAWLKRRTAALNLRNLAGMGLTRRDGAWVLAT
jgi:Transposase DDE domain